MILYFNNHWPPNGLDGPNNLSKAALQTVHMQFSSDGSEISGKMIMLNRDWIALLIIPRHVLLWPIIIFYSYLNSFR